MTRIVALVVAFLVASAADAQSAFGRRGGIHIGVADGLYVNDDIYDGITIDDATNSGRTSPFFITHTTSGVPAAGIGTCEDIIAETAAGNNEIGVRVCAVTTDVTATSEDFDFVVYAMAAGAAATEVARFASTGAATIAGTCTVQGATLTLGNNVNGTLTLTFDEDTANGSLTYNGVTFTLDDDLSITGTFAVTSTSDLQGDVSDSLGTFTIADAMAVTGTSDLQGDVSDTLGTFTVADAMAVTGTSDLQGDVSDTLGTFTIADAFAVTGTSDLQGDVSDTLGVFTIADAMAVTGTSDLQGDVSDSLGVFTIADAATITGAFTASSTSALNGTTTMGNDALLLVDVNIGITALAGGGQGGAGALTAQHNEVSTVATAADSVTLPAAVAGLRVYVANDAAANSMNVFPALGDNFVGLAANTAIAVIAGTAMEWIAIDAAEWVPSSMGRTMLRQLTPLHVLQAVANDPTTIDAERARFQPTANGSRQGLDFTNATGGLIGNVTVSAATGEHRLGSANSYFWSMYGGAGEVFRTTSVAGTAPHFQMAEDKLIGYSVDATITALAGGGQGGAGALTDEINEVSVVATSADSVTLPTAVAGLRVVVVNNGANAANVFPASGDNLGAGVNTAVSLPAATGIEYFAYDATNWESFINGVAASNVELNTLDGVAATLTATELNVLDGIAAGLTAAELSVLDGIAAGLTAAELSVLDGAAATLTGAELNTLDGVAATLVAAELNVLDGIAAGLTAAELSVLDGIAAGLTAAELSVLDGIAAGLTAAELSVLDGAAATLTGAELNTLDGAAATLTATELNVLDGIAAGLTAAELSILDGVTATATELNFVDNVANGATFVVGAETADAITVAVQLTSSGADLAFRGSVMAYLSSDVNGDVLEAASATLTVTGGTDGVVAPSSAGNTIGSTTMLLVSETDGDIDVVVTQTSGADTIYLVIVTPFGRIVVSAALTFV